MPVQYMTDPQLGAFLTANGNLDPSVRQAVLDQLNNIGVYDYPAQPGLTAFVQTGPNAPLDPITQVLDIASPGAANVTTGGDLDVIIDDVPGGTSLSVFGSKDVFIATSKHANSIILNDTGNDTIVSGNGADTISGGSGALSISTGAGSDLVTGGTGDSSLIDVGAGNDTVTTGGDNDTILGGAGNDSLDGAFGDNQSLEGGAGNDTLFAGGDNATLLGGNGNDWLDAGTGDNQSLDGGAGNDTLFAGGDSNTLLGGAGNDQFHITEQTGSDTIDGGAGASNEVFFDGRVLQDFTDATVSTVAGVTSIEFADGQTVTVTHVKELHFTDGTHNL